MTALVTLPYLQGEQLLHCPALRSNLFGPGCNPDVPLDSSVMYLVVKCRRFCSLSECAPIEQFDTGHRSDRVLLDDHLAF